MQAELARANSLRHLAAVALLLGVAVATSADWFSADRMPLGDFPGYAAEMERIRVALLQHARVPDWCVGCYGGASDFTSHLKEILAFPLAAMLESSLALKLATVAMRLASALALYALCVRVLGSRSAGVVAGIAYGFGAVANHQLEHLDMAFAAALAPLVVLAATRLLERPDWRRAVPLAAWLALQLQNNWVHALPGALAVAMLALVRPPLHGKGHPSSFDRSMALRWIGSLTAAGLLFCVLASSHVAWLIADAPNHRLAAKETLAAEQAIYIERSPFLYVNRDNVLRPWLEEHHPPGLLVADWDGGRRYLGVFALLVIAVGLVLARRDAALRRWAFVGLVTFALQYWLSLGPRTLLWQVGSSLQWSDAALRAVEMLLLGLAGACGLAALAASRVSRARAWTGNLLAAALLLLLPTRSLWSGLLEVLPLLEVQRSPGHFFETATLWLYLLLAIGVTAIARRLADAGRPRAGRLAALVIAVLLLVDFWPSTDVYERGNPQGPLREAARMVSTLEGEDGTLRMAIPRAYDPEASWVAGQSEAGHAWGWLPWQSGPHWADFMRAAVWQPGRVAPGSGDDASGNQPLLSLGRIRYLLVPAGFRGPLEMPPPWRLRGESERFDLYEQLEVRPMATGHEHFVVHADPLDPEPARSVSAAAARGEATIFAEGDWAKYREKAREIRLPNGQIMVAAAASAPQRPSPVRYQRPSPERILLQTDADSTAKALFVSEGHHPWWRAFVDGAPARVERAQLAFMAVLVQPGAREVALRFEPPGWVRGADLASRIGWLLVGAWVFAQGVISRLLPRMRPHDAKRQANG